MSTRKAKSLCNPSGWSYHSYSSIEHLCKKAGIEPLSPLQPKLQTRSDTSKLKRLKPHDPDRNKQQQISDNRDRDEREMFEAENEGGLGFPPRMDSLVPNFFQFKLRKLTQTQKDNFTKLPDEMILRIFKWLPKSSLGKAAQVCRRFERLTADETLWRRVDLMSKILNPGHLGIVMSRQPVFLRLTRATIRDPVEIPTDLMAPQLLYLDLSMSAISRATLTELLQKCSSLVKLSLEHVVVPKEAVEAMHVFAETLEVLNCTMCYELDAKALSSLLKKCRRLQSLNLGCISQEWSKEELMEVINALPSSIEFLNLSGFRNAMTDTHVSIMVSRCPNLVDLDLSDCQELTMMSVESIINLSDLQHLGLSRCYTIEPTSYPTLGNMPSLRNLELYSLFKESSLQGLMKSMPSIEINTFPFSSIARPTVGIRRSSIWMERVRD